MKHYNKLSYLFYKTGGFGVYKTTENEPIYGRIIHDWYDANGFLAKWDILTKASGRYYPKRKPKRIELPWEMIKNDTFAAQTLKRVGVLQEYHDLIKTYNDSLDTFRINLDNSAAKFCYDAGVIPEDVVLSLMTRPAIDNYGVLIISRHIRAKDPKQKLELKGEHLQKTALVGQGKGLTPITYQDNTQQVIASVDLARRLLCEFVGIREDKNVKKANLTVKEVEEDYYTYELAENRLLSIWQEIVRQWNKLFGEDNVIEKAVVVRANDPNPSLPQTGSPNETSTNGMNSLFGNLEGG